VSKICQIASYLIRVLQNIHGRGIVHRDLKPQNIMLDRDSRLYIIDYGISRKISSVDDEVYRKQSFVGKSVR